VQPPAETIVSTGAAGLGATNIAVPRPISRSALERLGRHLVVSNELPREHVEQLHELLTAYGPVLSAAVDRVSAEVGFAPSSRIKTTGTIIDKLRRNGGHTLSSIHDLAGMRLVVAGGRAVQDEIVGRILSAFADDARAPRVIDRRLEPVQGYRAVHVIVYPDGYPIEVQVRTEWQHLWAEWFERLADQYGREIRYGAPPVRGGDSAYQIVDSLIELSEQIAQAEESGDAPPLSAVALALATTALDWLRKRRPEQ
jgi:ppGpp synthetase/RelA/SpoT-type nucleotidyltranferase